MTVYPLYQQLIRDNFSLFYLGEFDDELTELLMRIQEAGSDEERSTKKRMNHLITECFQNIIRHSTDEHEVESISKFFMIRIIGRSHFIASANPIHKSNETTLIQSLESLQNLSSEELKTIYLHSLVTNKLSDKGGGGLGLIEMAKKTKNPPSYYFDSFTETLSNFFLQLEMHSDANTAVSLDIEDTAKLYHMLLAENIVLLRKGDFSQESILPLIKLFESNLQLKEENLIFKKKSLYILIELLQNMTKHAVEYGESKEGLFLVSLRDTVYTMKTGNYIKKDKALILKNHLDDLINLDKIQLAKRYKEQLMASDDVESQGAGLGIIEAFRQSDGEILYDFTDIDENFSFYSFSVTL